MKKQLILQILGNSDVINNKDRNNPEGADILGDVGDLEKICRAAKRHYEIFCKECHLDFPLLEKVKDKFGKDFILGIILTDQREWQHSRQDQEGWKTLVKADGIWWRDALLKWCSQNKIECYAMQFKVKAGGNGVADWEKMAADLRPWLNEKICFQDSAIKFSPPPREKDEELDSSKDKNEAVANTEPIEIEKIIIQHSSGTPALTGALYLWGIEQKVAGNSVEFIYLSKEDKICPDPHPGTQWQWRLKDPQIRELLKIQDFSGALKLLDRNHPNYKDLETSLVNLDKAVSLNLSDRDATATPDDWRIKPGRDMIIERVSIAYWSEKAFRERSQWMHWNLRIAGALELALFLLLEKQGNGNYQWEEHKLMFTDTKQKVHIRCDISQIVSSLLANGKYEYDPSYSGSPIPLKANQITGSEWANFKKFYIDNWKLEEKPEKILGYIAVRNQLYHSLMGDRIDRMLDKKTVELNNRVDHPDHPSQVAVKWLNYIIRLAGLSDEVQKRADKYYYRVLELLNLLT
ncbi:hypothetical protein [Kamptonema formosum]|uniref:hypothetical protein n=1 Tax=Kamptonema formosum TaxID=331992 RepID=UPI00034D5853|nr:hypothetical protein [Kamptonema formosum]